ncbi:MAG: hypothetical protein KatS3mg026_0463 [Bacteroidia bacterium]|nr:MAG: hypothetical protein KatS3mg026_0463 [Bacteroidia bacterium]
MPPLRWGVPPWLRVYPLQLPLFQVRRHLLLMLIWVLLWAIALGKVGVGLGVPAVFYDPRSGPYPTFWTTAAWGWAYGLFVIAYQLTTFLLDGHHAPFILREPHPLLQYALNNALLPLAFWLAYLHTYTRLHAADPNFAYQLLGHLIGFAGTTIGLLWGLSRWQRDMARFIRIGILTKRDFLVRLPVEGGSTGPVWWYFSLEGRFKPTFQGPWLKRSAQARILADLHRKALALELLLLLLIAVGGALQTLWEVYLPAGAAFLVLCAIVYMAGGAFSFWLRHQGGLAMVGLAVLSALLLGTSWLEGGSPAYGLSYEGPRRRPEAPQPEADSLGLVACLDAWQKRQEGPAPLVWIQVSGGGWRSAFWTLSNLQLLDSLSGGLLWKRTFALSGASGGLIGAALWRELGVFFPQRRWNPTEPYRLTQDALNPLLSTGLAGLLSPTLYYRDPLTGESYPKGRGWAFERALIRHTGAFLGRRLGDYAALEKAGKCPLLFLTPTLLPAGRPLLVSSQPVSFLTRNGLFVELRQLVSQADRLYFTTALRMNASFPFVLPSVRLPTDPSTEVIDAGAVDNHGELVALAFLWQMRAALKEKAPRIVLIEIRDLPPEETAEPSGPSSSLQAFLRRLSGLYTSFAGARGLFTSLSYEVLRASYPLPLEKHVLAFHPKKGQIPPLSLTLRPTDQKVLWEALYDSTHVARLRALAQKLR